MSAGVLGMTMYQCIKQLICRISRLVGVTFINLRRLVGRKVNGVHDMARVRLLSLIKEALLYQHGHDAAAFVLTKNVRV